MSKKLKKFLLGLLIASPIIVSGTTAGISYKVAYDYQENEEMGSIAYSNDHLNPLNANELQDIKNKAISMSEDSSSVTITVTHGNVAIVNSGSTENITMDKIISYFSWKNHISYFKVKKFFGNPLVGGNYTDTEIGGASNLHNFIWGVRNKITADHNFVYHQQDTTALKDTIINNEQELGVYFTGPGTFPWATFVKHSVLIDSNTTIFRMYDQRSYLHQKDFNANAFIDFKKSRGFNGRVIQRKKYHLVRICERILEYLEENKKKKINLFINTQHMGLVMDVKNKPRRDFVEYIMTNYPNVSIHGVEDGASMTRGVMHKGLRYWREHPSVYYPTHSSRIDSYSIIASEANAFDSQLKMKDASADWMSDELFKKRHVEDGSYFSNWAKIIGVDWQKVNKNIQTINANGKPSLLILGSYGVTHEKSWVEDMVNKYQGTYNVFYKGHPGHNDLASEISLRINNGEEDMIKQKLHILPTSIPSEELTNNHVSEGLKFNKFAMSDWSGAIEKIPANGFNTKHDLLEILLHNASNTLTAGTQAFNDFMQNDPYAKVWWGKYAR